MKMKRVKRALAVLLLLTSVPFTAAEAKVFNLGDISTETYVPIGNWVSGHFNDYFKFSLGGTSDLESFAQTLDLTLGFGFNTFSLLNIKDFAVELQQKTGSGPGGWVDYVPSSSDVLPSFSNLSFDDITAGLYRLHVSGKGNGLLGGAYFGNLQVAAVPELDTWLMLLIGVGLVAYQLRRKHGSLPRPLAAS
jgi:hypothetical protein